MTKSPGLTIITRTSARPNAFARLVKSISEQTYKNIKHIVLCDNYPAYTYAKRTSKQVKYPMQVEMVERTGNGRAFYNLYLNRGIEMVDSDYILFVDDDDFLIDNTCIERFWNHPKPDTGFYVVRFVRKTNPKPRAVYFRKGSYKAGDLSPLRMGKIGGSCVIFTREQAAKAKWDDRLASDFRFIKQLAMNNDYTFIPVTIVKATVVKNGGRLYDI
jgi:glycosyltransferase involved in cell wall biosynthesis